MGVPTADQDDICFDWGLSSYQEYATPGRAKRRPGDQRRPCFLDVTLPGLRIEREI